MRRPGSKLGTSAWKAPILTVTPSTLGEVLLMYNFKN